MPTLDKNGLARLWSKVTDYTDRKFKEVNPIGVFSLEMDRDGNLYAVYPDGNAPPNIEYDPGTGNVYLIIDE